MEVYHNIWFCKEGENEWDHREGWYFSDETEQLNGPYRSAIEAMMALDLYCFVWL